MPHLHVIRFNAFDNPAVYPALSDTQMRTAEFRRIFKRHVCTIRDAVRKNMQREGIREVQHKTHRLTYSYPHVPKTKSYLSAEVESRNPEEIQFLLHAYVAQALACVQCDFSSLL